MSSPRIRPAVSGSHEPAGDPRRRSASRRRFGRPRHPSRGGLGQRHGVDNRVRGSGGRVAGGQSCAAGDRTPRRRATRARRFAVIAFLSGRDLRRRILPALQSNQACCLRPRLGRGFHGRRPARGATSSPLSGASSTRWRASSSPRRELQRERTRLEEAIRGRRRSPASDRFGVLEIVGETASRARRAAGRASMRGPDTHCRSRNRQRTIPARAPRRRGTVSTPARTPNPGAWVSALAARWATRRIAAGSAIVSCPRRPPVPHGERDLSLPTGARPSRSRTSTARTVQRRR